MPALNAEIYKAIQKYCARGDNLVSQAQYKEAIAEYNKAWKIVPEPKSEWNASTWILTAIGDACYLGGYMQSAREAFEYALVCPEGIGNPFIHKRYGQILYDAGEFDAAADELIRAYMGAGQTIFENEDNKYLDFLKTKAII